MRLNALKSAVGIRASIRRSLDCASPAMLENLEQRALLAVNLVYNDLGAPSALPDTDITVNSTISNAGDPMSPTTVPFKVTFYLSTDNVLDRNTDTVIGSVTRNEVLAGGGGILGFPATVRIPAGLATNTYFLFGEADSDNAYPDDPDRSDNVRSTEIFIGNRAPTIGSVTANPDPVGRNGRFTLTASNVADMDGLGNGPLTVQFFYDRDGDGVLSTTSDLLLGSGAESDGAFTLRVAAPNTDRFGNPVNGGRIFARASDGIAETDASTMYTIVDAPIPSLGDLTGPTSAVRRGRVISLVATGINANNTNPVVSFFRDSNGSGAFEEGTDTLLPGDVITAGDGSRTLQVTIDPSWGPGNQTFFATATDDLGQTSAPDSLVVSLLANQAPRFRGKLVAGAATYSKGQTLVLTARNITDDDGPERVEFFRESSGNSSFNATADTKIGEGTRSGNAWTLRLTIPSSFRNGLNRFYARAVDIVGATSAVKTVTATITRNTKPTMSGFVINRNSAALGSRVQFLAQRVLDNAPNTRVQFWFDADGNGRFNANADRLIIDGRKLGATSNFRRQFNLPTDLPTGTGTFFAVAIDNLGMRAVRTDTLNITA